MSYDPRATTGIPTEPVGSLPRPQKLQDAYAAYDKGDIDKGALEKEQDAAVKDSTRAPVATVTPSTRRTCPTTTCCPRCSR